jgi:hypothetical protein
VFTSPVFLILLPYLFRFCLQIAIIRNLDVFADKCLEEGSVSDEYISEILGAAGVDMKLYEATAEAGLDQKQINLRRCCWLSLPEFRQRELERKAAKAAAVAAALQQKADQLERKQKKVIAAEAKQAQAVHFRVNFVQYDVFKHTHCCSCSGACSERLRRRRRLASKRTYAGIPRA